MKFLDKKSWKSKLFLIILTGIFVLSGCGNGEVAKQDEAVNNSAPSFTGNAIADGTSTDIYGITEEKADYDQAEYQQMIIYNGNFSIEVDDIKSASDELKQLISSSNGSLLNSSLSENEESYYAHYQFRVPVNGFNSLIDQLNKIKFGKINYQNVSGIDVTEEYVDLESRLKAKRAYEARLLDFLERAEKTEDLLKISNDLNRVQEEIEQIVGRQNYLKHNSDYSMITIDLVQYKDKAAPTASAWEKAIDGFKRSINFVVDLFTGLFIWFITLIPILLIVTVILIAVVIVYKRSLKEKLVFKAKQKSEIESNNINKEEENRE